MEYITELSQYKKEVPTAVTFGKFDGVHRGHQKLVETVRELGKSEGVSTVMCRFDMRPLWKSRGLVRGQLMTQEERYACMDGRIDTLIECPFDEDFRVIPAEDFIRDVIVGKFHAGYVVVGVDFRFGKDQGGDVKLLKRHQKDGGYRLIVIEKERHEGRIISSSYIREALEEGNVPLANAMLGYRFHVGGRVEGGKKLGRTLGFPTINIRWPEGKLVPPRGVYVTETVLDGKRYPGISNIGVKPTVSEKGRDSLECYLLDFDGDLYGKQVDVELLAYKRPEKRFGSVAEMKAQVDRDIADVRISRT